MTKDSRVRRRLGDWTFLVLLVLLLLGAYLLSRMRFNAKAAEVAACNALRDIAAAQTECLMRNGRYAQSLADVAPSVSGIAFVDSVYMGYTFVVTGTASTWKGVARPTGPLLVECLTFEVDETGDISSKPTQ